jgi:hypothetical protein
MNILLWTLQILLALYYMMGGGWMVAKTPKAWFKFLPKPVWMVLGVLQVLFALALVVPGAAGVLPMLTPIAAVWLAVQTVAVAIKFTPMPGLLWAVLPALLALFVAYGRIALQPF